MAKKQNIFTQHLFAALQSVGYSKNSAKMIVYGQSEMKILPNAIKMSKAPWYISPTIWGELPKERFKKQITTSQSSQ